MRKKHTKSLLLLWFAVVVVVVDEMTISTTSAWIPTCTVGRERHHQVVQIMENHYNNCRAVKGPAWSSSSLSATSTSTSTTTERDDAAATTATTTTKSSREERLRELVRLARAYGPVGVRQSMERQEEILNVALSLRQQEDSSSIQAPPYAHIPLTGIHKLLYSSAPGGSSGKLGFIDGIVTQTFVNRTIFINAVTVGPLKIALTASRTIKSNTVIQVQFHSTTISFLDIPIITKATSGGGTWNMVFVGTFDENEKKKKLIRVMQTPSLFVLEHDIVDDDEETADVDPDTTTTA